MAGGHEEFESSQNKFFRLTFDSDWEEAKCLFSEDHHSVELFEKNKAKYSRCECGFVYASKQPTEELLNKFYQNSEAMRVWASHKTTEKQNVAQGEKFSRLVEEITKREVRTLCDIGCGTGKLLSLLPDSIEKTGIEPNDDSMRVAQQSVEDVFWARSLVGVDPNYTFDCMTLTGVLEHVKDPESLVNTCYSRLNPGGYLCVVVPNLDSFLIHTIWEKASTFCPQHLWYFNKITLGRLMNRAGFKEDLTYTVETESLPVARYKLGFHPYRKNLEGIFSEKVDGLAEGIDEMVRNLDSGYKIVGIYKK